MNQALDEQGEAAATVDPARRQRDLANSRAIDIAYGSAAF